MDPGGIGKGYAVDRMVEVLRKNGFRTALIAGSGSSIYGMGAPPDEPRGWPVKIKDPWDNRKTQAEVFSEGQFDVHFRKLRKVFSGGRQNLRPYHGPADRISGAGSVSVSVISPIRSTARCGRNLTLLMAALGGEA